MEELEFAGLEELLGFPVLLPDEEPPVCFLEETWPDVLEEFFGAGSSRSPMSITTSSPVLNPEDPRLLPVEAAPLLSDELAPTELFSPTVLSTEPA